MVSEYEVTFVYPQVNVTVVTYHDRDQASTVREWAEVTASEAGLDLPKADEVIITKTGELV
jgi:hypothetical protein